MNIKKKILFILEEKLESFNSWENRIFLLQKKNFTLYLTDADIAQTMKTFYFSFYFCVKSCIF